MTATAAVYPFAREKAPGSYVCDNPDDSKFPRPDADWIAMDDVQTGIPTPTAPADADDLLDQLVQSHLARSVGPGTEASQGMAAKPVKLNEAEGGEGVPQKATELPTAAERGSSADSSGIVNGAQVAAALETPASTLQEEIAASTTAAELDALLSSTMDADEVVRTSAFSSSSAPATLPLVDPSAMMTQDAEPNQNSSPFVETKSEAADLTKIDAPEPIAKAPADMMQVAGGLTAESTGEKIAAVETQPAAPITTTVTATPEPTPAPAANTAVSPDAGVTAEEGTQLAASAASDADDVPSPQTHVGMRSRGFIHDFALMVAQLADVPFTGIPAAAKSAGALVGALLAVGGVALVIVARVSK